MAQLDPLWGILSEPDKKFQKWDVDEFFLRGENDVTYLMHCAKTLGYPQNWECALDFGCGVGRVTIPLSKHFQKCYGLDISEVMINKAKTFAKDSDRPPVYLNDINLEQFSDGKFDLVYSVFVLQHIPEQSALRDCITEFVRVLKKGGLLVLQIPTFISRINRTKIGIKLYRILAFAGIRGETLYNNYGLLPVTMNYIADEKLRSLLAALGAKVLDVQIAPKSNGVASSTYYVTK